jgi:hypothetical protein
LANAQGFDEAEILINDSDPRLARLRRAVEFHRPAGDLDRAAVEGMNTTENLDQGRFSRAVLAQ